MRRRCSLVVGDALNQPLIMIIIMIKRLNSRSRSCLRRRDVSVNDQGASAATSRLGGSESSSDGRISAQKRPG